MNYNDEVIKYLKARKYDFKIINLTLEQQKNLSRSHHNQKGDITQLLRIERIINIGYTSVIIPFNNPRNPYNSVIFFSEKPNSADYNSQNYEEVEIDGKIYLPYSHNYEKYINGGVINMDQFFLKLKCAFNNKTGENTMNERTEPVLEGKIMHIMNNKKFLVIGCGGVGSIFTEFLIRTGVKNVTIIDDDIIEKSNLNRVAGSTLNG